MRQSPAGAGGRSRGGGAEWQRRTCRKRIYAKWLTGGRIKIVQMRKQIDVDGIQARELRGTGAGTQSKVVWRGMEDGMEGGTKKKNPGQRKWTTEERRERKQRTWSWKKNWSWRANFHNKSIRAISHINIHNFVQIYLHIQVRRCCALTYTTTTHTHTHSRADNSTQHRILSCSILRSHHTW